MSSRVLGPLALLVLTLGVAASAQSSLWPPVLLSAPSDPAAPAATAVLLPGKTTIVNAIAVDAQDNVYVAGTGNAPDLPGLDRGFDPTPDGGDAFVAKLDRNGSVLWATYLGGTDGRTGSRITFPFPDTAQAIAVDAAGQVIVAGATSAANFPLAGAFQPTRRGEVDGFIAKLSADGRRLIYSSYIGATGDSMSVYGVAVGVAGDMWVAALSPRQQWLATNDLTQGTGPGQAVVIKLNPAGSPVWSTRLALWPASGFAVDGTGRAHASGARCTAIGDCQQVLVRLDPSGTHIQFSTSFPNRLADVFRSEVVLLPGGRAAMTGATSDRLPVRNAWKPLPDCRDVLEGCANGFIAIADESGVLETVSYLGLGQQPPIVAADPFGRVTVAVPTTSANSPLLRPLVDRHVDGPVFVSRDRATTWQVQGRETLPSTGAADLVFSSLRNALLLVANAIFDSRDEGATWRLESRGGVGTDVWYRVAVDPRQPSIRYGIFGDHVFRHDEGAADWRMVSRSPPGTYRRSVVVSPHDSSIWIAGNAGVAMSTSGDTWIDRSAGLPNLRGSSSTVADLDFDPRAAGVVYAMTQVGLYRSSDNGATWDHLTNGLAPQPSVRSVAFDPVREQTIHAGTLNYGMLTTTDGGRTWRRTLEGSRITVVRTDQMKRHIVYAAGSDASGRAAFYRSIDHGATWHRATDGLDLTVEPARMLVDPRDSAKLYLASSGMNAVPYVMRLQRDGLNPHTFATDFATYLAHGRVRAIASTLSGGIVAALSHGPPSDPDQQQTVILRIAP